jgi:excisionase family DNA binding protein
MLSTERTILNSREAAEYLGISLNTLYRIEKQGDLQPFRTPGGHRRYDLRMLNEYLEGTRFNSNISDHKGN